MIFSKEGLKERTQKSMTGQPAQAVALESAGRMRIRMVANRIMSRNGKPGGSRRDDYSRQNER